MEKKKTNLEKSEVITERYFKSGFNRVSYQSATLVFPVNQKRDRAPNEVGKGRFSKKQVSEYHRSLARSPMKVFGSAS